MVDISERVREIKKLVDAGKYFTINRARQYGKTTTIDALCRVLYDQNIVISLDFLAQLRSLYLKREKNSKVKTFQSVILAGVTDVKHLKSKIRGEADAKENSPWNIAADFNIDMSLSETGIQGMLNEYEADRHTG